MTDTPSRTPSDPFNCPKCGAHDYGLFMTATGGKCIHCMKSELTALRAEAEGLREKLEERDDFLWRSGFVPCDNPICNCGSLHHRYGLPERWQEIKDVLTDADVLNNDTGNMPVNAIKKLIEQRETAERERKAAVAAMLDFRGEVTRIIEDKVRIADGMIDIINEIYELPAPSLAEGERIVRDAERYRWLRSAYAKGDQTYLAESITNEKELDAAIDAQREG